MSATSIPFVLSVDTEEDNWTPARSGWSTDNVSQLPKMAARLGRAGLRLTYFTTYTIACDPRAFDWVQQAAQTWRGEVAAHLHPWNTPPIGGPPEPLDTMLCNHDAAGQARKLATLTDTVGERLGRRPNAFRAGRFGLNADTVRALIAAGYRVDSSVTPLFSWRAYDAGPDFVGAPLTRYRLGPECEDVCLPAPGGPLVELPLSAGYTRLGPASWGPIAERFARPAWRRLKVPGLAARAFGMRRVILSPETNPLTDLVAVSQRLVEAGVGHLQMFFHSSSLRAGLSPFTPTRDAVERMLATVERYMEVMAATIRLEPMTVSEAGLVGLEVTTAVA